MTAHVPIATTRSATGIPTGRLAMWWVLGSEIVIFGGLLSSYVMLRLHQPHWAAEASHTSTLAGAFNTNVGRFARNRVRELESHGKTVKILGVGRKATIYLKDNMLNKTSGIDSKLIQKAYAKYEKMK